MTNNKETVYVVEFFDSYQGTREIHVEATSPENAMEIVKKMGLKAVEAYPY